MVGIIDIYQIGKEVLSFYNKRKLKKIPIKKFILQIERRIGTKLSKNSAEEIIENMEAYGEIKVITSCVGHKYIIIGNLL